MTIYPAIDLKAGRCVRLLQGRADAETVYHDDPVVPAEEWKKAGTEWLHLVDLDGAFEGMPSNLKAVRRIIALGDLRIQLGGGLRNEAAVNAVLEAGVERAIIGTRACSNPDWTRKLIERFGSERIAVGIDTRDGMVATKGWVETTEVPALDLARRMSDLGVRWIIHTDVATDGAMKGPNLQAQQEMAVAIPDCKLIASGGMTNNQDLDDVNALAENLPNIEGVIIGKSLYEGTIDLTKALQSF
jgi:phosphoribosylformimino-5-aminoimidazole carboxamide ribotide isomerase